MQLMNKKELRKLYIEKRTGLTYVQKHTMDDLLLIQFQRLQVDIPSLIMTYSPMEKFNEFDPQLITDYCYFKNPGQQLFYPVMGEENGLPVLYSVIVDDNTVFVKNKYGINEPVDGLDMFATEIDMVIVPLLCADKKGNRVGYGKGFYDTFLKECRKDCIKVGFSYFPLIDTIDDVNKNDVRLNFCITPDSIHEF